MTDVGHRYLGCVGVPPNNSESGHPKIEDSRIMFPPCKLKEEG